MKSISNQILLSILFTVIIAFGGWGIYEIINTKEREENSITQRQTIVADRLSVSLEYPISNLNKEDVEKQIKSQIQSTNILSIQVFDKNNKPYLGIIRNNQNHTNLIENNFPKTKEQAVVRPILQNNKTIGKVVVYANKKSIEPIISDLLFKLALELITLIFIIATTLYLILRKVIIKPLSILKDWASSVDSKNTPLSPEVFQSKELNSLMDSFSLMTERLISSHNEISEKNRQLIDNESRIKSISGNFTSGMIYQLIIKTDGTRTFTYLSDSVKTLYGITPEEGIADSSLIYNNIHPEDIEPLINAENEAMQTLSVFRKEARMKHSSGIYRWSAFVSKPKLQNDGSVCWDGIEFDVTDLKNAEEKLKYNQFLFESIIEGTSDAVFIKDEKGRYLVANTATVNFIGKEISEILGKDDTELFSVEDGRMLMENDREIMISGVTKTIEEHMTTTFGPSVFSATKGALKDEKGNTIGMFGISRDITEQKNIENELHVSQQKFALAFNSSPDAVLITEKETGRIIEMNEGFTKIYGYSREEALGKTTLELNVYNNDEDRNRINQAIHEHGYIRNAEFKGKDKYNSELTLLITVEKSILKEVPVFISTIHDITERKKMEEELRISQEKFAAAFNSVSDLVFISEQETGLIIDCNDAITQIFGYTREEAIGKTTLELNLYKKPEDRQKVLQSILEFGFVRNIELTGVHKNQSELSVIVSIERSIINKKNCFIVTIHDITERKKTEEELRISQEKFALAFHSSPDAIFISDQETGEFLESNNSVETIFGYNREEVIGKTGLGLNLYKNPEDRQKVIELLLKNGFVNKVEVLGRHKNGSDLNVLLTVGLEVINGRPCFITTVHDITERKKTEEELRISQQKFAIAFNSSPDAILITEQETGIIMEVNDSVKTIFGFSREELIGKTGHELNIYNNPEDRQKAIDLLNETGHIKNLEVRRKHKSGSDLVLLLTVETSIIGGKPCFISTNHDITKQKLATEKLLESEERFKSIISVSNTGAWEYHTDTDYLWCSPEYFSMLGLKQSDYEKLGNKNLQETWIDLIHPDDKEHAINHFAGYLKNGSIGIYENQFRMKHTNGNWIWIWSRGQTLRDSKGKATNLTLGTHIDITERKLTEIELQKLNVDKDRFISILGHDLRGPFNSILSVLDLLCLNHDIEKEESEELLQLAYKSAKNTASLLDDVLTWATAQSGKMSFNPEVINFKDNSTEVIELLQPTANSKNISIELHSNDNLMINADKNMTRTILRNLISNALKFTNTGGQITVSAGKIGDISIISVSDNGVGIDPKNISKIFDKGQLFSSTGTADEKGTGFGLKLCQELVEKHKGKIWVESELDKGATFYFTLPDPNVQN